MGTRRRRRLDVALLAVAAVLVGVAALGGAVAASSERVTRLWAEVGAGGAAAAVQAWELRVRTPAGSGLWLRAESFRRFGVIPDCGIARDID